LLSETRVFFPAKYKTPDGTYKQQPVIFSIDGWWTDNVKNTTDKDGLVHEEIQHNIYNEVRCILQSWCYEILAS
jgi:hypothetical protein